MKSITVTLNGQEITISIEDQKMLKKMIDSNLADLDETIYQRLKVSSPAEVETELETMGDDQLLELARLIEKEKGPKPLNKRVRSELFKRAGIGYKQLSTYMSKKQREYLESIGLSWR
ncbi:hypothetical protein [Chryseobacterium vrystaatense]|uniref:Uncharacterized protein n=1 Tax=Chryseobacterium vrystaatense TaxID=307480 RepID=A0A1M4ZJ25_9FLAO|nr:hypothetical protein [Chryseobacterium vrystaatense]SHF17817.1 hypothetical protein SAMN02787073_1607 [Chryseobacterium vrystaatense]